MSRRASIYSLVVVFGMAASASAQVKLEYKFLDGMSVKDKTSIKSQETLTIAGTDTEIETDIVVSNTTTNGKRNADKSLPIAVKFASARVHLSAGGLVYDFDTADPNAKDDGSPLAFVGDVFKILAGSSYTIILDDKNRFKATEGTDKILDQGKDDPKVLEALKEQFSPERLKREYDEALGNLPMVLARKGEPWETTETADIGAGQKLVMRIRYEYLESSERDGRTLDKLSLQVVSAEFKIEPDKGLPFSVVKSDVKVESSKGTILFDREAGVVLERQETTRLKGELTLKMADMELPGALDLSLTKTSNREIVKPAK